MMANGLIHYALVFVSLAACSCTSITPHGASYNITCDVHLEEDCDSSSLEDIADQVNDSQITDVRIDILIPTIRLNVSANFDNLSSLCISGDRPGHTTIECSTAVSDVNKSSNGGAGIVIRGVNGTVTLNYLKLVSCGAIINIDKVYISALTILYSANVRIDQTVIRSSTGIGLMVVNHAGGDVNITSSSFEHNWLQWKQDAYSTNEKKHVWGGGGLYIKLIQFLPRSENATPISFLIEKCTFLNNTSHTAHFALWHGNNSEDYGLGGGAYVIVRDNPIGVRVSFVQCEFVGNHAFFGGGAAASIMSHQETNDVVITIRDSRFEHNGCYNKTMLGGGLRLYIDSDEGTGIVNTHFIILNVSFFKNCAKLGGGVYFYSYRDALPSSTSRNTVLFNNCTFKSNHAHIGSAVAMLPDFLPGRHRGYKIVPVFRNCNFTNNRVFVTHGISPKSQKSPGVGTFYASLHDVDFQGCIIFSNNWGSAVYAVNAIVNFQHSHVYFVNNTGFKGGALALIGLSEMILGPNSYRFVNNRAILLGGAVYVSLIDITDFTVSKSCFFQYNENDYNNTGSEVEWPWRARVTFSGNRAKDEASGHSIYATSLHPCHVINTGSMYKTVALSAVFHERGFQFENEGSEKQIATDGAYFSINKQTPLMIIPGEYYEHGMMTIDDLGQESSGSFRVGVVNNSDGGVQLDPAFSTFIGVEMQLTGPANDTATLLFEAISPRETFIKVNVTLLECPPGFKFDNLSKKCVCNTDKHFGLLECDEESFHSYLIAGYWAGRVESSLVTSVCPLCVYSSNLSKIALPQKYSDLNEVICGETRTGIACGKCRENYTVHFHSPSLLCKTMEPLGCRLGWLFYFLSELLPVTIFFVTALVFNISFISGTVNGFVLYVQLLSSLDIYAGGLVSLCSATRRNAMTGYQVLYGFLNLDFFNVDSLSFCLWKGATVLDMIAFKCVTILYTALIIVGVIFTVSKCGGRWLGKFFRITAIKKSTVHGISTFLVISYAQSVNISLKLLTRVYIYTEYNSHDTVLPRVWFNAEVVYFSKEHLPYAIPALFCIFTVGLLPPYLLFVHPLLNKGIAFLGLEETKIVKLLCGIIPVDSLKPFLDSFQGCFKDNFRFFAGLYFIYRWIFRLIYLYSEYSVYYTTVTIALVVILATHTVCQPYTKRSHNIVDALLFSNLLVIASLSFFNFHQSRHTRTLQYHVMVDIQLVLIYLPLVAMAVYLLLILCKKVIGRGCKNRTFIEAVDPGNTILMKTLALAKITDSSKKIFNSLEDLTHDRLIDEDDTTFESSCGYHKDTEKNDTLTY